MGISQISRCRDDSDDGVKCSGIDWSLQAPIANYVAWIIMSTKNSMEIKIL